MPRALDTATAWVAKSAWIALVKESDRQWPLETGGILLGYRAGSDYVVTAVIGPGPEARHLPRAFAPDANWQADRLAEAYAQSERRHAYLGDWHTHPDGPALLSRTDKRTLRKVARFKAARCPSPLMLLLAGGKPWRLRAFRQVDAKLATRRIRPVSIRRYAD
jgi:integrative and conjugative element protein (TIGR02256 family)